MVGPVRSASPPEPGNIDSNTFEASYRVPLAASAPPPNVLQARDALHLSARARACTSRQQCLQADLACGSETYQKVHRDG
jgi:hypothetical protein